MCALVNSVLKLMMQLMQQLVLRLQRVLQSSRFTSFVQCEKPLQSSSLALCDD
jgi:hypothetical protein